MHVTAIYGALLTLMVVALGFRVSQGRLARLADEDLRRRIRVHANLVENAPLFVVMLGVAEQSAGDARVLHGLGAAFLMARLSHAVGLSRFGGRSIPRFLGIVTNWTMMVALSCYALWLVLS